MKPCTSILQIPSLIIACGCAALLPLHVVQAQANDTAPSDQETEIKASATVPGFGVLKDPSGECRVTTKGDKLSIAIPPGVHVFDAESGVMNAPRILQEKQGDFTAEVTVSEEPLPPEAASNNDRGPFEGAGLLLMVSPETYIRLERAQVRAQHDDGLVLASYPSWELRLESKPLRYGSSRDGVFEVGKTISDMPVSFRITRRGNTVSGAYRAKDGEWHELDPLVVQLPEKVSIGVAASSNVVTPTTASFTRFSIRPADAAPAPAKTE